MPLNRIVLSMNPDKLLLEKDSGERDFENIVAKLLSGPPLPYDRAATSFTKKPKYVPHDPTFDSYCIRAVELLKEGKINTDTIRGYLDFSRSLPLSGGLDYLVDLLRIVSNETQDTELQKQSTELYLRFLAGSSFALRASSIEHEDTWMRKARKAAKRGLGLIESINYEIDLDIHADLLLAMGQTYSRPTSPIDPQLGVALDYYLKALDLKEKALNSPDFQRLAELIKGMISFMLTEAPLSGLIGHGTVLRNIELANKAARRLKDYNLIFDTSLQLCKLYSVLRQPENAENLAREVLSSQPLDEKQRDELLFALASSLSEQAGPLSIQSKAEEAEGIQNSLISKKSKILEDPVLDAYIWLNLGNSKKVLNKTSEAEEAYNTALTRLGNVNKDQERQQIELQIRTVLADTYFSQDKISSGIQELQRAESLLLLPGADEVSEIWPIHYHSIIGSCYLKGKMYDQAINHLEKARKTLYEQLVKGPQIDVWESMLREWTRIDGFLVRAYLAKRDDASIEQALTYAEASKSRILTWLRHFDDPEAPKVALSVERIEKSIKQVQEWLSNNDAAIISLYADTDGLAIFSIYKNGKVEGRLLDKVKYRELLDELYIPWEKSVQDSIPESDEWLQLGKQTDNLLEIIGAWLEEGSAQLEKGGKDLVIIPHRSFRNLPLSYCKLQNGMRLSDCFERISVVPTLFEFYRLISNKEEQDKNKNRFALVDPDGSLPYSELDGLLTTNIENVARGSQVNMERFLTAISQTGTVLLSAHGDFDEANPWQSRIFLADKDVEIHELLKEDSDISTGLVVLGVCEAAKSRHSTSDEPLGFPTLFIQGGVRSVIAPIWKVEDIATTLFLYHFFGLLDNDVHPSTAVMDTAKWLSELKIPDVLTIMEDFKEELRSKAHQKIDKHVFEKIEQSLDQISKWHQQEDKSSRPFSSPVHWAAFQFFGFKDKP
jgi:tetratricopeptide (TPR) repeat protein